jgi:hypothetical protein
MLSKNIIMLASVTAFSCNVLAKEPHNKESTEAHKQENHEQVSCVEIAKQRQKLSENTRDKGFGPQAPRDIDELEGNNIIYFNEAPDYQNMNLCNIHFHKNAEHAGGEFTKFAGNGDGHGYQSGYQYSGKLSQDELKPVEQEICPSKHGSLSPGDTIEVHYVHSSAMVSPGPTLKSCLSESNQNPQLRVEAQVFVLVNDDKALDFLELTKLGLKKDLHQALNIPSNTGRAVNYAGSTTGPSYNEVGSPFQVSWSVRPKVAKVNISTVGQWCKDNVFKEDHAHGVRNLIINTDLLSPIKKN